MELVELALANFRKFTDERFRFCPGLNLFWGPNESGKSTVHQGICCALFGRDRGEKVENWNGGSCSVQLTYRSDGKLFRIERRLPEGTLKLGSVIGDELADVVSTKDEIDRILADHLGIASRTVFNNTISIGQLDVSRPEESDMAAVGSEIQRVLTGTAQVSAAEALKNLETGRNATKGKARPRNPREYDRITDRLHKLAEELANARRSRQQISNLEEELDELQDRSERDSARLEALEALLDRHKRWSELTKWEAEAESVHKDIFGTVVKLRESLADLASVQKELEGYADLVGKDAEVEQHLSKIESRRGELAARLDELKEEAGEVSRPAGGGLPRAAVLAGALAFATAGLAVGFIVDPRAFLLLAPAGALAIAYVLMRPSGGRAEPRQIAELGDSARQELKQLDAEEKSIVSYVKCRDAAGAWAKIRNYRGLAARAHELEVALNAMLGGRKLGGWEAQEADLARELSNIQRELEEDFAEYSPTTEEAESWRSEYAKLQNSLPPTQARLHEVRGSLEAQRQNSRDLAALEGEIEFLHDRKSELEFLYKVYDEAIAALEIVMQDVSEEYLPVLAERSGNYLRQLTSGRYTSVCIKPGWEMGVDCRDRSGVEPAALSVGTVDQLYFTLRIACGDLLSAGRRLPIVLDDPFVTFDRRRLDNALDMLGALAAENQMLLLTHDPYVLDWARDLASSGRVPCVVHELQGPAEGD